MNNTISFLIELLAVLISIVTVITSYFATREVNRIAKDKSNENIFKPTKRHEHVV